MRLCYIPLLLMPLCIPVIAGEAAIEITSQALDVQGRQVTVEVPKGYRLELLSADLDAPRLLTFDNNGDLLIGSRADRVYRLRPPYTTPEVLLELPGYPHSVAVREGELLIARTDGVYRADYTPATKRIDAKAVTLLAALPGGGGHNSRSIAIGPDGRVYVSLGITGNCSDEYLDPTYPFKDRRGGILVLEEDKNAARWVAYGSGLRNPVGFDWHPATKDLHASNNGPDHHGFEQPPEYFSRVTAGSFHGMPWYQYDGTKIQRDNCILRPPPLPMDRVAAPVATFPARNAPMGVAFVPTGALDESLEHDAIVALRGSWGTQPSGSAFGDPASRREPKLVAVRFKNGNAKRVDDLVAGFQLVNGDRWTRPVGVAFGPDGALYFTSDSGVEGLYRLRKD